mmetsp:Transcript_29499/g.68240  ORF Transcript_29499/g.68240 Transcript_29499/m.68240 type:complete len:232 (+) Transcript_29499:322-1017(+)
MLSANAPGFLMSLYFNMCAAKLRYEEVAAQKMRARMVTFLQQEGGKDGLELWKQNNEAANDPKKEQAALEALVLEKSTPSEPLPISSSHENTVVVLGTIWMILLIFVVFADLDFATKEFVLGCGANLNLLFFYAAPLSTIYTVVTTRNSAMIHIWTMIMNTANGTFWTAYGFAIWNPYIYVLNAAGVALGVVQVILLVLFPRKENPKQNRQEDPTTQQDDSDANLSNVLSA